MRSVPDPEIPVSVIDLGIVREIADDYVTITPTYTGCPATLAIEQMIRRALDDAGFANVRIDTALSPPWSTDWISDEGREKLRTYGIARRQEAPTPRRYATKRTRNAQCCGSMNTKRFPVSAPRPAKPSGAATRATNPSIDSNVTEQRRAHPRPPDDTFPRRGSRTEP